MKGTYLKMNPSFVALSTATGQGFSVDLPNIRSTSAPGNAEPPAECDICGETMVSLVGRRRRGPRTCYVWHEGSGHRSCMSCMVQTVCVVIKRRMQNDETYSFRFPCPFCRESCNVSKRLLDGDYTEPSGMFPASDVLRYTETWIARRVARDPAWSATNDYTQAMDTLNRLRRTNWIYLNDGEADLSRIPFLDAYPRERPARDYTLTVMMMPGIVAAPPAPPPQPVAVAAPIPPANPAPAQVQPPPVPVVQPQPPALPAIVQPAPPVVPVVPPAPVVPVPLVAMAPVGVVPAANGVGNAAWPPQEPVLGLEAPPFQPETEHDHLHDPVALISDPQYHMDVEVSENSDVNTVASRVLYTNKHFGDLKYRSLCFVFIHYVYIFFMLLALDSYLLAAHSDYIESRRIYATAPSDYIVYSSPTNLFLALIGAELQRQPFVGDVHNEAYDFNEYVDEGPCTHCSNGLLSQSFGPQPLIGIGEPTDWRYHMYAWLLTFMYILFGLLVWKRDRYERYVFYPSQNWFWSYVRSASQMCYYLDGTPRLNSTDPYFSYLQLYGWKLRVPEPTGYWEGHYSGLVLVVVASRVLRARIASANSDNLLRFITGSVRDMVPNITNEILLHNTVSFIYQTILRQRFRESQVMVPTGNRPGDLRY
jgi:hypothetical protein